jgi:hypothetical protein
MPRRSTITLVVKNNKAADAVFKFANENPSVAIVETGMPSLHITRKYITWINKNKTKWRQLANPTDDAFEEFDDLLD